MRHDKAAQALLA